MGWGWTLCCVRGKGGLSSTVLGNNSEGEDERGGGSGGRGERD